MTTYAQLLRGNPRFRRLWLGQVVSELGNWFNFIAVLGLARSLSGEALAAGGVVAASMLPFCLLGPFAGALADRFSRRAMMIASDLARAALSLGFLFADSPGRLWIAYACLAAMSAGTAFFEAAKNAAMPNLARGGELLPANALMHANRFLQMALGALAGGVVSEQLGYQAAFALNALSFLVSAAFVWQIPASALADAEARGHEPPARSGRALGRDIADAFAFIRRTPLVLGIVLLNLGWALGGGMSTVINDRFGGIIFARPGEPGDRGVAILTAAGGVGLMLGMLVARRVGAWVSAREWVGPFMGWGIAASGLVFAASGAMPNIWAMGAVLVLNRVLLSAEYAVQETVLMVALPDGMRGKVFTIDRSIELSVMALSAMAAGVLVSFLPPRVVPVVAGLLMAAPGFVWVAALSTGRLSVARDALAAPTAVDR